MNAPSPHWIFWGNKRKEVGAVLIKICATFSHSKGHNSDVNKFENNQRN